MQITRLRLLGFKSFVDPTELVISPGLTGVVGPNGCGKSNLLEALRWVMGETSYKSMRASVMDDVIFSGTSGRPARNHAEVMVTIDNSDRTAPSDFNAADELEITRRITREAGSAYRINGREARARDVKILFEDAATGTRSPSLVRQGQIGELVNAKPEHRRRILEDAAGIAGLHSRRHDAELRLKAAESNLARIGDVLGQMSGQLDSLKRQARQAERYKALSQAIRRAEAAALYLHWQAAAARVDSEEAAHRDVQAALAKASAAEAEATAAEAAAAEKIAALRKRESDAGSAITRLKFERETAQRDLAAARDSVQDLEARKARLHGDIEREVALADEARETLAKTQATMTDLAARRDEIAHLAKEASQDLANRQRQRDDCERNCHAARDELSARKARHHAIEAQSGERRAQVARFEAALAETVRDLEAVHASAPDSAVIVTLEDAARDAEANRATAHDLVAQLQDSVQMAWTALESARAVRNDAVLQRRTVQAEHQALHALVMEDRPKHQAAMIDAVEVAPGYEAALGAALKDDLDAAVGEADAATKRWRGVPPAGDGTAPALPAQAEPLSKFVSGPPELALRLSQIGVVVRDRGDALQARLAQGQRLVSRDGDVWRWDGLTVFAGGPIAAAVRLEQRNRLAELSLASATAEAELARADGDFASAQAAHEDAVAAVASAQVDAEAATTQVATANDQLHRGQQAAAEHNAKVADLTRQKDRADADLADANASLETCVAQLQALAGEADPAPRLQALEAELTQHRTEVEQARARAAELSGEARHLEDRLTALEQERARCQARDAAAGEQMAQLELRLAEVVEQLAVATARPSELEQHAEALSGRIETTQAEHEAAAEDLAQAERALRVAGEALKEAQAEVVAAREARARSETRLENARHQRSESASAVRDTLDCCPEQSLTIAGLTVQEAQRDTPEDAQTKLDKLKIDRDRLGGVNLQAGEQLGEIEADYERRDSERRDVEAAIAKLRGGIGQLNRKGRKRLLSAFDSVNQEFASLFQTLFGGGEARLEFIDSGDPLESGLEIVARPPGKKPTTLSLLSGGEQTLTALSLIFAVFLTNPSPICVLDEVDAPLDDANVDRFCSLMDSMTGRTKTRFLIITHHPMTMARMDRLFGVTMAERGVSQLVSVDLSVAEQFAEAS